MDRVEELNKKCAQCFAEAAKKYGYIDRTKCAICPIGMEVHELEVRSSSKWNEVDWNSSRFEGFYHH